MPLYEYKCGACGHRFERIVKFSDPPLKICPQCGKDAVEQLIHAPAVQFKGSGWYVSDYARKSSTPASAKASGGGESASASAESSGKESAPAAGSAEKSSSSGAAPDSSAKPGSASKPDSSSGDRK